MTTPPLVVQLPGKGRMYEHPVTKELFPSVTNVIGILDKPALVGWAARESARAAWHNRKALVQINDEEAAVDMIKNAHWRTSSRAASLGDSIHETCEALSRDEPLPSFSDQAAPYLDQFLQFVTDFGPKFSRIEGTVFSSKWGYAGTFDFLMLLEGYLILGDHKTGKGVYPETALQLAALAHADEMWSRDTGELEPMPVTDACIALHLQPERYAAYLVNASETAFQTFLGLLQALPWAKGGDKGAIGASVNRARLLRALAAEPRELET